jgi:hypothetical protein
MEFYGKCKNHETANLFELLWISEKICQLNSQRIPSTEKFLEFLEQIGLNVSNLIGFNF